MNVKKFAIEQAKISGFMLLVCATLLYLRGEYLQAKPWEWHYNCWIITQLFVVWVIGGHMCVTFYRIWEAKYQNSFSKSRFKAVWDKRIQGAKQLWYKKLSRWH